MSIRYLRDAVKSSASPARVVGHVGGVVAEGPGETADAGLAESRPREPLFHRGRNNTPFPDCGEVGIDCTNFSTCWLPWIWREAHLRGYAGIRAVSRPPPPLVWSSHQRRGGEEPWVTWGGSGLPQTRVVCSTSLSPDVSLLCSEGRTWVKGVVTFWLQSGQSPQR